MRLAIALFVLLGCGCATQFTGSAQVEGDRPGCERKCASVGLQMQAFVFMGEYSTACVCEVPGGEGRAAATGAAAAAVGVMTQMQETQEDAWCLRDDCGRFGD